jgi:hypothetical protein
MAVSVAGRIGYSILKFFMVGKLPDIMSNASFYFKVRLPEWWPQVLRNWMEYRADIAGLPQIYLPGDYLSINWSVDAASLLLGACLYLIALLVVGFGCSVWYSGMTVSYAVLAQKKDEKNILELPEDDEELIEPVVKPEDVIPPAADTGAKA